MIMAFAPFFLNSRQGVCVSPTQFQELRAFGGRAIP